MVAVKDIMELPTFQYDECQLKDLECRGKFDHTGRQEVNRVCLGDKEFVPTQRFWDSICSRFGFGPSVFKYFSHRETFDRISEVSKDDRIRITTQETPGRDISMEPWMPRLLAISGTDASIITGNDQINLLNRLDAQEVTYRNGIIVSRHKPRTQVDFDIGGDIHKTNLLLETPIDAYGRPSIFLNLLRIICENGVTGYSKAFKSSVILGRGNAMDVLDRAVMSYSNEDGFMALQARVKTAQKSWASVLECVRLAKLLWQLKPDDFRPEVRQVVNAEGPNGYRNRVITKLYEAAGDLRAIYGVAQLDSLSEKRMRQLPSEATVYSLICFATEIATHQLESDSARMVNGYVGNLLGGDIFDLENSCEEFSEFKDFMDPISVAAKSAAAQPIQWN